jgi:hypothetical protein
MAFKKLCALSRAAATLRENPSGKGPLPA